MLVGSTHCFEPAAGVALEEGDLGVGALVAAHQEQGLRPLSLPRHSFCTFKREFLNIEVFYLKVFEFSFLFICLILNIKHSVCLPFEYNL